MSSLYLSNVLTVVACDVMQWPSRAEGSVRLTLWIDRPDATAMAVYNVCRNKLSIVNHLFNPFPAERADGKDSIKVTNVLLCGATIAFEVPALVVCGVCDEYIVHLTVQATVPSGPLHTSDDSSPLTDPPHPPPGACSPI